MHGSFLCRRFGDPLAQANLNDVTTGTAPKGAWSGSYVVFAFMAMISDVSVVNVVKQNKHLCILDDGP
jgi:hypothetical protein